MPDKRFVVRLIRSAGAAVPEDVRNRHMARLEALHADGIVENYGSVANNEGGIQILTVQSREEAERFVREDPMVIAGVSRGEIWEWNRRP